MKQHLVCCLAMLSLLSSSLLGMELSSDEARPSESGLVIEDVQPSLNATYTARQMSVGIRSILQNKQVNLSTIRDYTEPVINPHDPVHKTFINAADQLRLCIQKFQGQVSVFSHHVASTTMPLVLVQFLKDYNAKFKERFDIFEPSTFAFLQDLAMPHIPFDQMQKLGEIPERIEQIKRAHITLIEAQSIVDNDVSRNATLGSTTSEPAAEASADNATESVALSDHSYVLLDRWLSYPGTFAMLPPVGGSDNHQSDQAVIEKAKKLFDAHNRSGDVHWLKWGKLDPVAHSYLMRLFTQLKKIARELNDHYEQVKKKLEKLKRDVDERAPSNKITKHLKDIETEREIVSHLLQRQKKICQQIEPLLLIYPELKPECYFSDDYFACVYRRFMVATAILSNQRRLLCLQTDRQARAQLEGIEDALYWAEQARLIDSRSYEKLADLRQAQKRLVEQRCSGNVLARNWRYVRSFCYVDAACERTEQEADRLGKEFYTLRCEYDHLYEHICTTAGVSAETFPSANHLLAPFDRLPCLYTDHRAFFDQQNEQWQALLAELQHEHPQLAIDSEPVAEQRAMNALTKKLTAKGQPNCIVKKSAMDELLIDELIDQLPRAEELLAKIGSDDDVGSLRYLFIGEPGTGKSALAQALAERSGVEYFWISGPMINTAYQNEGSTRIAIIFETIKQLLAAAEAKERADTAKAAEEGQAANVKKKKFIIVIDEIDSAKGQQRESGEAGSRVSAIQAIGQEIDNLGADDRIIVIGTTCAPHLIQADLKSRFEEIKMPTIDDDLRKRIILYNLLQFNKPLDYSSVNGRFVDKITKRLKGADARKINILLMSGKGRAVAFKKDFVTSEDLLIPIKGWEEVIAAGKPTSFTQSHPVVTAVAERVGDAVLFHATGSVIGKVAQVIEPVIKELVKKGLATVKKKIARPT